MAKTISKKISVKASAAKHSSKPPPVDKTLGLDPVISFYTLKDGDETAEAEEAQILVIHNSNLAVSKQNLVKRKFPYINTFYHEVTSVVNVIRDLTIIVCEHL